MTLCVGIEYSGSVYMAGDRFAGDGSSYFISDKPKIIIKKKTFKGKQYKLGFAYCDEFVCSYILEKLPLGKYSNAKTIDEWTRTTLKEILTEQFEKHNIQNSDSDLIIGVDGKVYGFYNGNVILRNDEGFLCVGAGEQNAFASWLTIRDIPKLSIQEKLLKIMKASEKCNPLVKSPFDIVEIK